MSLKAALQTGLSAVPDCAALCYVDMGANLVLATEAKTRRPQEVFNALSGLARSVLEQGSGPDLARNACGAADVAYLAGETGVLVLARSLKHPAHAVCFLCDQVADFDALAAPVRAVQEAISDAM